ncbi:hypothetical protein [Streptomyces sp. NPDC051561]|uniref:hypothetical protein n=1 Tax=Streptomyces sp. NPDC051561 TaxID=3365658 RepID=UPI00379E4111
MEHAGTVKDHGWAAPVYVCDGCLDRLHRTVRYVAAHGQSGRCWLWCGGRSLSPADGLVAIGTVEIVGDPLLPPVATADLIACTPCIRLIGMELQRLAQRRDGGSPSASALDATKRQRPTPRRGGYTSAASALAAQEFSPGGHLTAV